jgi:hypothetical protein
VLYAGRFKSDDRRDMPIKIGSPKGEQFADQKAGRAANSERSIPLSDLRLFI